MRVSLLMHELLPLNFNFQVKMSKITLFAFLEKALLKHVGFLYVMASKEISIKHNCY